RCKADGEVHGGLRKWLVTTGRKPFGCLSLSRCKVAGNYARMNFVWCEVSTFIAVSIRRDSAPCLGSVDGRLLMKRIILLLVLVSMPFSAVLASGVFVPGDRLLLQTSVW